MLLSLKVTPSEPCELLNSSLRDPLDIKGSPKDPQSRRRRRKYVSSLGSSKRSASIISDSGIESRPSSVALPGPRLRSRTLELPSDRDFLQLVRRHALHRNSLEGAHREQHELARQGSQASLTSISSLPRGGGAGTGTHEADQVSVRPRSVAEESAEDADSTRHRGGQLKLQPCPPRAPTPQDTAFDPAMAPQSGSWGRSCLVEEVSAADNLQGPSYIDIPKGQEDRFDPQGPCCLDGRTDNPPGVETKVWV